VLAGWIRLVGRFWEYTNWSVDRAKAKECCLHVGSLRISVLRCDVSLLLLCGCCSQCKEVALIHSEGILAGEMKHGPLALVDEHLPIVVVATKDSMYKKMESVIQQLLARSARLIIVCTAGDTNMQQYVKRGDCQLIEVRGIAA
jgi:hypothetical protein